MISNVSTGLFKDQGVESAIVAADLIGLLQQQSMEVVKDGQSSAQPTPQSASVADLSEHGPQFKKKDVVDVQSRMTAGMNKPGGVGRITKIRIENTSNPGHYCPSISHTILSNFCDGEYDRKCKMLLTIFMLTAAVIETRKIIWTAIRTIYIINFLLMYKNKICRT